MSIILLFSCSNDSSPTKPAPPAAEPQDITGRIYMDANSYDNIEITLQSNTQETSFTTETDYYGEFKFIEIPPGEYTLSAGKDDYIFSPEEIPVTVAYIPIEITEWFGLELSQTDNDWCYIFVSVIPDKGPLKDFQLYDVYKTDQYGKQLILARIGESIDITPHKTGYDYDYTPKSASITADIDNKLIVQSFTAHYTGSPLHSVTGRVLNSDGSPFFSEWNVKLSNEHIKISEITDDDGYYRFTGIAKGTYTVTANVNNEWFFKPESIEVTVDGEDVVIEESFVFEKFTGPTDYNLYGMVLDREGNGIAGVHLSGIPAKNTDESGEYDAWVIANYQDREITITPEKDGCVFEPSSYTFTIIWIDGVYSVHMDIPDFLATDYTEYNADEFFPRDTGLSWTYDRSDAEGNTAEYTMTVDGKENAEDLMYSRFSPTGPGGMELLRTFEENVYAWDGDEAIVLIRFGVIPGTEWESGNDKVGYARKGIFHGREDVNVPAGTFTDCLHIESKIILGSSTYDSYEMWFAENVGLVRQVRKLVNYGRLLESAEMELTAFGEQ